MCELLMVASIYLFHIYYIPTPRKSIVSGWKMAVAREIIQPLPNASTYGSVYLITPGLAWAVWYLKCSTKTKRKKCKPISGDYYSVGYSCASIGLECDLKWEREKERVCVCMCVVYVCWPASASGIVVSRSGVGARVLPKQSTFIQSNIAYP